LRLNEAQALGKPFYVEETGIVTPGARVQPTGPCRLGEDYSQATCSDRPSCFDKKLTAFFSSAIPISGALIWQAIPGVTPQDGDCFAVGHIDVLSGPWDPVDDVVSRHRSGVP
jgi:hypothetical protein